MSTFEPVPKVVDLTYYEEKDITVAQFTDGGAAVGTYQLQFTLPVGFFVAYTQLRNVTGFTGNVSAVLTVGDGSDADRYNAGTPSVFTTIAKLDMCVPSGTRFIATANKPTLTITSNADFTAVTAGELDIRIYGWQG